MSVTSGRVLRAWTARSAVVLGVVFATAACGGGDAPKPRGGASEAVSAAALKTCQEVFGAADVDALRSELGSGFRPFGRSLTEMRDRLVAEARGWTAGQDDLRRTTYHPCELEGGGDGGAARITATVAWSTYDIDFVRSGEGRLRWRETGEGAYTASRSDGWGIPLVMPCTVPGSSAGQGRELPLQVAVKDEGRTGDPAVPTERLLKSLAEKTRGLLGCTEKLTVPADLLP
ncbi:hypothetical protein ACIQHY_23650 [Streptomyces sp. NPDC092359]|uniref:hypothetical protein n=1 Tax=Streptomyces sp. NPDC092359 TaxID=3366014 RepID=UPI003818884A